MGGSDRLEFIASKGESAILTGKSFPKFFAFLFSIAAGVAYLAGLFSPIERVWHDRSFLRAGDALKAGDPKLLLIAIDDETVAAHGFPLPRSVHARALDRLRQYGAKTVVFDVLFFEQREGDAELVAATQRHGRVVHLFTNEKEGESNPHGTMAKVQMPVPGLARSAQVLGCPIISDHIDGDGHIRTFSLFNPDLPDPIRRGQPTASLAAAALASFLDKDVSVLNDQFGGAQSPIMILNYRRPVEWLRHEKDDEASLAQSSEQRETFGVKTVYAAYRHISMKDLLADRLTKGQREALKGSLAMIGSTTIGYFDHYPTPFSAHSPGAEHHLNIIDNVMAGDYLRSASVWTVLLLVVAAAWIPFVLIGLFSSAVSAAGAVGVLVLLAWVCTRLMSHGVLLYPVAPGLTLLASFLVLTVHRVLTEGAQKKMIIAKFGQFVSPEIVDELANNPDKAKLGAQKREMTVFFLDIAHFTTISEKMGPEALIEFLNKYLSALSSVILDRRGTIDKYIGDCIMAFWNAPLENADHARDAVLSALECQRTVAELNKSLSADMPVIPAIRIGINTGPMNVGFTGTERKLAYTVIGDEVNLASRLEGANKFFGSDIIISASTYEFAKDAIEARFLGRARVVGKVTPVPVYEPVAAKGKLSPVWMNALPIWEKGTKAFFDQKYDEALAAFEEFLKLKPKDGPAELYIQLSRDYAALPPDNWDQVFNLTAK